MDEVVRMEEGRQEHTCQMNPFSVTFESQTLCQSEEKEGDRKDLCKENNNL